MHRREAGEWTSCRPRNLAAGCSDWKLYLATARFQGYTVYMHVYQYFEILMDMVLIYTSNHIWATVTPDTLNP